MIPDDYESDEVQWGAALEAADLGTFYVEGPDFENVKVSKSYWRQFRLEKDQRTLTKSEIFARILPEDRETTRLAREQALRDKTVYDAEYRMMGADGRIRWINAVGRVTTRHDGTDIFAGVTIDITKRKKIEAELVSLYNRDKRIAQTFQRLLLDLPQLPSDSTLNYEPFYEAYSKDEAAVGGDFLDVVNIDHYRTAFVVGDVQGHGLQAASVALEVKLALHAFLSAGDDASTGLSRVNKFAVDRNWASEYDVSFVLLTVCVIDKSNNTLEVAMAGGYPPILLRGQRVTEFKREHSGVPIGIERSSKFTSVRVEIAEDDLIALFTDGLTELRSLSGEQLQVEGLQRLLKSENSQSNRGDLKVIGSAIMNVAKAHARTVTDDICLMLVRC